MRNKLSFGKKHFEIYTLVPAFSIMLSSVFVFSPFNFGLNATSYWEWMVFPNISTAQEERIYLRHSNIQKNDLVENPLFLNIHTLVNKNYKSGTEGSPGISPGIYLQHISIHSVPFLFHFSKKTENLQWQYATWQLEKSRSVQIAFPAGWEKTEEFTDWVFVAGMFSFSLPRCSWLDQSTNRRKEAHLAWPCHPKWLWHF